MARVKLIFLGIMAIGAIGAVSSSSALAAHEFLELGQPITKGLLFLSKQTANSVLEGGGTKITCTTVLNHGFLLPGGKSDATVTFESCTVGSPEHCTVEQPIVVKAVDQLVLVGTVLSDEFKPEGGGTKFTTLKFSGAECSLTTLEVNGQATGSVDNLNQALAHVLTFSATTGSNLTIGGALATFKLKDEIWLENDDLWSVI